jgi:hypothetical protein
LACFLCAAWALTSRRARTSAQDQLAIRARRTRCSSKASAQGTQAYDSHQAEVWVLVGLQPKGSHHRCGRLRVVWRYGSKKSPTLRIVELLRQ